MLLLALSRKRWHIKSRANKFQAIAVNGIALLEARRANKKMK
jgi:hypothetical protein